MDWSLIGTAVGGLLGGNVLTQWISQWHAGRQKGTERSLARHDTHRTELRSAYAEFVAGVDQLIQTGSELVKAYKEAASLAARTQAHGQNTKMLEGGLSELDADDAELKSLWLELERTRHRKQSAAKLAAIGAKVEDSRALLNATSELVRRLKTQNDVLQMDTEKLMDAAKALVARWSTATENARTKGVTVHLLENDSARRAVLESLLDAMGPPPISPGLTKTSTDPATFEHDIRLAILGLGELSRLRDELMKLLAGIDAP